MCIGPGGLPDAAQATCSTSNANATNITSSTMNRDSLWIGLSITFTLAMAIGLSIGFVIYRQVILHFVLFYAIKHSCSNYTNNYL
jgi:hypothetical protein